MYPISKKSALAAFIVPVLCSTQALAAPTTFVHLFEWSWSDIAIECEEYLGPTGYAAVQVSPPQEHIIGSQWWTRYQPVSYVLDSRSGNRQQFIDMVERCDAAGVDIYVDAVVNHMAAGSGTGTAGNTFADKSYPIYSPWDFHNTCEIHDYGNREQVQNCELVGLADLNTGDTHYVQNTIADYLNDLVDIGVAGFRIDAAKHIAAHEVAAIIAKVNGNPVFFQEVIDQGGEAVAAAEYTGNGLVTEFKYSVELGNTFRHGSLAWLRNFGEGWGFMPSYHAVVFVDNHDNQRGHGGGGSVITFQDGRLYDLANVFMLAYPYGYPKVMSSYDYHGDTDAGRPAVSVHNQGVLACFGSDWQCEHRWSYIAGAMSFRNNTNDHWSVNNWWDNGHNQIAFSRGEQGFVAINKENSNLQQSLYTGMTEGSYCNVLTGGLSADTGRCNGDTVTVNASGYAQLNIAAWEAVAIHHNARLGDVVAPPIDSDWQRTVVFIRAETASGQDMFVRGGIDHAYAANHLGLSCTNSNYECGIPITHNNLLNETTAPWKSGDSYLDWYGAENAQSTQAEGSAMDWTVDVWPSDWGVERTVVSHGYGVEELNIYGPHYWMLDVQMDCSKTANGWFELKAYVKNGQGWEGNISQPDGVYSSNNHLAECGKINTFEFNANWVEIRDF